jgi:hypothetical protein
MTAKPKSNARHLQEVCSPMRHPSFHHHPDLDSQSFLLQRVQPGLSGLMDGSLSTLAPIFAVVLATHHPLTAFYTGLATQSERA